MPADFYDCFSRMGVNSMMLLLLSRHRHAYGGRYFYGRITARRWVTMRQFDFASHTDACMQIFAFTRHTLPRLLQKTPLAHD